ncbi:MAG: dihydroorotate dehydrogenase-like protein [Armatimonadota bacterium]|nr:dihydroorotate dehydrogenase-like protein [bacterium]
MADISTSYMGIELASPVIVGASTWSRKIEHIKRAEDAGAGALVIHSLFQEQIELETEELDEELGAHGEEFPEALSYFPHMEHAGPREHVMWVENARRAVAMPLIGSLNATSVGEWVRYARQLEEAGCNALELNLYSVETNPDKTSSDIEKQALDVIATVKNEVSVPVAVKLSPFYTSLANFARRVVESGADGLVIFNRFYQPFIDPDNERADISLDLSRQEDTRLPLRWIGILSSALDVDLAASTGVHTGKDVIRHILAGAKAVQCVSTLYQNGLGRISEMNNDLAGWMDSHGYGDLEDFRGELNRRNIGDPYAFERAQYVQLLMGHRMDTFAV